MDYWTHILSSIHKVFPSQIIWFITKTLDEVIEMIESFKQYVIDLKNDGWELIEEVSDDYGYIKQKVSNIQPS